MPSVLKKTDHSKSQDDLSHPPDEETRLTQSSSDPELLTAMRQAIQEAYQLGWNAAALRVQQEPQQAPSDRMQRHAEAERDETGALKRHAKEVIRQELERLRRGSLRKEQFGHKEDDRTWNTSHGSADSLVPEQVTPTTHRPHKLGVADTPSSQEIQMKFHGSPEHPCMAGGREPSDGEEKEFSPRSLMRIKKNMLMQQEKQRELEEEHADIVLRAETLSPSMENYREEREALRELEAATIREIQKRIDSYNSMASLIGQAPRPTRELRSEITADVTTTAIPRQLKPGSSTDPQGAQGVIGTSKKLDAATLQFSKDIARRGLEPEWNRPTATQPVVINTRPRGAGRGIRHPLLISPTPTGVARTPPGWNPSSTPRGPMGPGSMNAEQRVRPADVRRIGMNLPLTTPDGRLGQAPTRTPIHIDRPRGHVEQQRLPAPMAPLRVQTQAWQDFRNSSPEEIPPRPSPYPVQSDSLRKVEFPDRGNYRFPEHNVAFALREWMDPVALGFDEEHLMYLMDTGHPLFGSNRIQKWDLKFNEQKFPQFKGGLNEDLYQYNRAIRKIVIQHGIWGDALAELMLTRAADHIRRRLRAFGGLNADRPTEVYKLFAEIHAEDNSRETLIREFRSTRQQLGETHTQFLVRLLDLFERAYGTSASLARNYWDRDTFCKQFHQSMDAGRGGVIKAHFKKRILDNPRKYHRLPYHEFLSDIKEELRYALIREQEEELILETTPQTRQPQRYPRTLEVNHLQEIEEEEVWAVLEHCQKKNLCFNCKEPGHFAADCRNAPQGRTAVYPVRNPEHSRRLKENNDRAYRRQDADAMDSRRGNSERDGSRQCRDESNDQWRLNRASSSSTQFQERRNDPSNKQIRESTARDDTEKELLVQMCLTMSQLGDLLRRRRKDDTRDTSPEGTCAETPAGNQ